MAVLANNMGGAALGPGDIQFTEYGAVDILTAEVDGIEGRVLTVPDELVPLHY
jgi:hypothetical protein